MVEAVTKRPTEMVRAWVSRLGPLVAVLTLSFAVFAATPAARGAGETVASATQTFGRAAHAQPHIVLTRPGGRSTLRLAQLVRRMAILAASVAFAIAAAVLCWRRLLDRVLVFGSALEVVPLRRRGPPVFAR